MSVRHWNWSLWFFLPRRTRKWWVSLLIPVVVSGLAGHEVRAETLAQALALAYEFNPTLKAERARVRAIDEEVPRARSGYRPIITGNADAGVQRTEVKPDPNNSSGRTRPRGYGVTLTQPIFSGFRTINSEREADANVLAAREDLRQVEQTVLLDVITAYMDVVRDKAIVDLRQNNVNVLSEQLRATQDRFEVGEVTRTDVAQASARRSGALSALSLAQANLKTSQATYRQLVGRRAKHVKYKNGVEKLLPRTLSAALRRGETENPLILAALYREAAARHAVDRIRGELLPEVSLEASYQRRFEPSKFVDSQETSSITGRVNVPLYQAGEVSARVRQAKQTRAQRLQQIDESRKQVQANVVATWGQVSSTRAQIISDQAQVNANRTALNGVVEEEKVGQRTVLDVLDAEQELLDSRVTLVGTRRNYVVAAYSLVAASGRLTAVDLGLHVNYYDPQAHYWEVRRKWFGLRINEDDYNRHHYYGPVYDYERRGYGRHGRGERIYEGPAYK